MMQSAIEIIDEEQMKKPISGKDAKTFEIYGCEEAGISLTVKATGQGGSSVGLEGRNKQMHMLKPCDTSTRIICLINAVADVDFRDDDDYESVMEDLREQGRQFGNLVKVVIPRPNLDHHLTPVAVKVFLEYADLASASRARSRFHGNRFGPNQVVALYYPENKYAQGDFDA
ncbi:unnamed protein product [Arabis nemorensis]|uniref:RRM domain-containing protein n=1 Tax=Arabis nemorensis TaxID=586526 RepID=A0A565AVB0_9BRAS|nr:unnamed protein product [Arabis nemorensis]